MKETSHSSSGLRYSVVIPVFNEESNLKVLYTRLTDVMKKLKEPQSREKAYLTSSQVVVDEVGYLPVDSKEAYLFFQFVSHRYEKNSTIITSNKSFTDWQ